jgi:hypothetical protein
VELAIFNDMMALEANGLLIQYSRFVGQCKRHFTVLLKIDEEIAASSQKQITLE